MTPRMGALPPMANRDCWPILLILLNKNRKEKSMRPALIVSALLAFSLSACGQKEENAQPEVAPAPVATAPAGVAEPSPPATPAETTVPAAETAAPPAAGNAVGESKYAASCASCHGAKGQGMGTFPKLVGLTAETVKSRLATYKAGKQVGAQSAVMMPIASMLTDAEVDALAAHIATLK